MKNSFNILFIILLIIASTATAQRRRTTAVFDADTTTRPLAGFYGVGVRDGQPWLVSSTGDAVRLKVEDKYIVGKQLNTSGNIENTYQGRRTQLVTLNKDSLTVTLPNPRDSVNQNRNLTFMYFGFKDASFAVFDITYAFRFSDTVFAYDGTSTYFFVPNTWMGSMTSEPSIIQRKIKPVSIFYLSVYDKRWYLHFNGIDY